MNDWVLLLLSYLLGAVPFSYLFGKYLGKVDISQRGSGNIGATNVLRSTKISVAVLALMGDLLKGLIAAWIGLAWGGPVVAAACGVFVVVGHCYTIFLSFRGGKGVATAAGVILFLMPQIFLVLVAVMILSVALTRYVSLGSVLAAALLPILCLILIKPWPFTVMSFFLAALVLFRHHSNIKRLISGQEARITDKAV
ncbi:MAG TPA: acyl-phosphate glycerol 3-phosphate acyltransferase [Syntrophomonas sp.]|jgi:glycerol-3-phosphate acyltransferase PlsY|nr:acyl-phosphate glycerol 3-phosphate acyltransferase [Syntrophomonas sp.]